MSVTLPREDRFFIYGLTAGALPAAPLIFQIDGDAFYEITSLHFHTGQGTIFFEDIFDNYTIDFKELGSSGQSLFNVPILPQLVFSNALSAKSLRTPFVLAPNSMLQVNLALAPSNPPLGAAASVEIALWGVKRYQMSADEYAKRRQRPYFVYATTPILQANVPSSQYIQVATDADFVVQNLVGYGDLGMTNSGVGGGPVADFKNLTIQITDESTQKQLFENPMPWSMIVGQAQHNRGVNRLMSPLIFRRNTAIRIDFIGSVTTPLDIQFGFEGYKIKD